MCADPHDDAGDDGLAAAVGVYMLAVVGIGFDADRGVRAGNKVVHTHYLLYKLTHRQRRDALAGPFPQRQSAVGAALRRTAGEGAPRQPGPRGGHRVIGVQVRGVSDGCVSRRARL